MIGAGTVLDAQTARLAHSGWRDFLSPVLAPDMIALCNQYDKLRFRYFYTEPKPLQARRARALMIKVFPVGSVGPQYIRDLLRSSRSAQPDAGRRRHARKRRRFLQSGCCRDRRRVLAVASALAASMILMKLRRAKAFQEAAGPRA